MDIRRIKRQDITMADGTKALVSTVELEPGLFETIVASSDFEEEYVILRTTSEEQALCDFKHLVNRYHIPKLTGKYAKLSKDLAEAKEYGLKKAFGQPDGGTCNFDAVAIALPRWKKATVEKAALASDLGCFQWNMYGEKRFVFSLRCQYQGDARTLAAEAMEEKMKELGYDCSMYYQLD